MVTIDELLIGSIVVLIINYLYFNRMLKISSSLKVHLIIVIVSALAFLINRFLGDSPMKMPLTLIHTVIFIFLYYYLLLKPAKSKLFSKILLVFTSISFMMYVMSAEGTYRALKNASAIDAKYTIMLPIGILISAAAFIIYSSEKENQRIQ